jgi:hypothetical protein
MFLLEKPCKASGKTTLIFLRKDIVFIVLDESKIPKTISCATDWLNQNKKTTKQLE